jgi:hypothetical protein
VSSSALSGLIDLESRKERGRRLLIKIPLFTNYFTFVTASILLKSAK